MTLKEKYPDTMSFHFYNANPKNRVTADCEFRAISTALNQDYNSTVMEMAKMMCETGYALVDSKGEEAYLRSKGWVKHKQPRKDDGTKYTGEDFCHWLNNTKFFNGKSLICHIGGHHTVCIKEHDGLFKVFDIWNSTDGCIGNYYTKG